jgi:hypothetical protein
MVRDVTTASRSIRDWASYQKGFEVLASSVGSARSRELKSRKSLTVNDLLVKVRLRDKDMYRESVRN